jgi:hypothetical protein
MRAIHRLTLAAIVGALVAVAVPGSASAATTSCDGYADLAFAYGTGNRGLAQYDVFHHVDLACPGRPNVTISGKSELFLWTDKFPTDTITCGPASEECFTTYHVSSEAWIAGTLMRHHVHLSLSIPTTVSAQFVDEDLTDGCKLLSPKSATCDFTDPTVVPVRRTTTLHPFGVK